MIRDKLSTIFSNLREFILDIFFPIKCIACGKEGNWICESCESRIKTTGEHVCGVCEKMITPDGRTCQNCKKKSALSGLVVSAHYANFPVAHGVHLYKYRFISDLSKQLGNLMVKALQKTDIPLADAIIPIPLHPRRLRWRGFNQSGLLAEHIAANLLPQVDLPLFENILVRKKYTLPQMGIKDYKNRKQNIEGAFSVTNPLEIKNRIILLVDDVATTGSTIFECARVLKNAGAKEIYAAVIARQEIKKAD
jgi:competence protein ComFC